MDLGLRMLVSIISLTSAPLPPCFCSWRRDGEDELFLLGGYGVGSGVTQLLVYNIGSNTWRRPVVGGHIPLERSVASASPRSHAGG